MKRNISNKELETSPYSSTDPKDFELSNDLLIFLIGCNYLHESIINSCLEITDADYIGRIKTKSLLGVEILLSKNNTQEVNTDTGLFSYEWINKTYSHRPSVAILVYDTRNKPESMSWKEFENNIFLDINKTKGMDNYSFMSIIVIVYTNSSSFSFDGVNEEKERSYNIKKILEPKNLFYINGVDGLKAIGKKINKSVLIYGINYYKNIKISLKMKKSKYIEDKEKLVSLNIKLGIIAYIKNRKPNYKYFEEAYNILTELSVKMVENNNLRKFYEYKNVADWLYYRRLSIIYKKHKIEEIDTAVLVIPIFNYHIQMYSKVSFFDKGNLLSFRELDWKTSKYEEFAMFLEKYNREVFYSKSCYNFPGFYYLLAANNTARMISCYKETLKLLEGTKLSFDYNKLKTRTKKYFGKFPHMYLQIDPLTSKDIEFDDFAYSKMSISGQSEDKLQTTLMNYVILAQKVYQENYLQESNTMGLFFNNILMKTLDFLKETDYEKLLGVYQQVKYTAKNLAKFPQLFLKFYTCFNELLLKNKSFEEIVDVNLVFDNLVKISSVRELSEKENEAFDFLLKHPSLTLDSRKITFTSNNIIKINFEISSVNLNSFDVVEYNFTFTTKTTLSLTFKSIKLFFSNEQKNKHFFKEKYTLSRDNDIKLNYSFMVNNHDDNLKLKSVVFDLDVATPLVFEVQNAIEPSNVLRVKKHKDDVIQFEYPKQIKISNNQFFNFPISIFKKSHYNLEINSINIKCTLVNTEKEKDQAMSTNGSVNITQTQVNSPQRLGIGDSMMRSSVFRSIRLDESISLQNSMLGGQDLGASFNINASFNQSFSNFNPMNSVNHMQDTNYNLQSANHEFVHIREEEKSADVYEYQISLDVRNLSEEGKELNFLFRFFENGTYTIKFEYSYKINNSQVLDIFTVSSRGDDIKVEVDQPFTYKMDFNCENYISYQNNKKAYPNNKPINIKIVLNNYSLGNDMEFTRLDLLPESPDVTLESPMQSLLEIEQITGCTGEISLFRKCSEYTFNVNALCLSSYLGSLGKVNLAWTDDSIKRYKDYNIFNTAQVVLERVEIKQVDYMLLYKSPTDITGKVPFDYEISVINKAETFKKLMLVIDTTLPNSGLVISGAVNKKFVVYPYETKTILLNLIPVTFGKIKLPSFKVMEFPFNSEKWEGKKLSLYTVPEYISVKNKT